MKKKIFGSLVLGLALVCGCASTAMADSRKVVTLGADLTEDQQNTIMKYFGVSRDAVDIIYIDNDDEREHLGSYVPLEQIGTKTFSCALVSPTTSGGIQVKTANLSWVTCNMIASTLSTSGVKNCQVVAACPFTVSGTGALTGVIMAYEEASEETLDPVKKQLANEELVTTGNLADEVGQSKATAVMNETKIQVIENNVTDKTEINNIINEVSNEYNVEINSDQTEEITVLMQKIAEQEYDIEQLKGTLERVQANVAGDAGASEEEQRILEMQAEEAEAAAAAAAQAEAQAKAEENNEEFAVEIFQEETDSILDNTDIAALEEDGIAADEGTTTQTVLEQSEEADPEIGEGESLDGTEQLPDEQETEETEEELNADDLDYESQEMYEEVKANITEEFSDAEITGEDGTTVWLTEEASKKVPEAVEKYLLKVLVKGSDAVAMEEAADPEITQDIVQMTQDKAPDKGYEDSELQQMDKFVRRMVFEDSEDLLADSQLEEYDEVILYQTIMTILEGAFGVEQEEMMPEEMVTEAATEEVQEGMEEEGASDEEVDWEDKGDGEELEVFEEEEGTF
ncbi:MAG: DUF1002 domain-containing protein [Muricoprocola sp.]